VAVPSRNVEQSEQRRRLWLASPPEPRPRRTRLRKLHVAAILAAVVYVGGMYVAYEIYRAAWHGEGRLAGVIAPKDSGAGAEATAPMAVTQERAAALEAAEGIRGSVFQIDTSGGGQGSAFVAWTIKDESFLIAGHRTVAGILQGGAKTVFVRGDGRFWAGRIVRANRDSGLVLIKVEADIGPPLWQQRGQAAPIASGDAVLVVPAGESSPIGQGVVGEPQNGRLPVRVSGSRLNVGAPVVDPDGTLVGVVTRAEASGLNLLVPIETACDAGIRRCG
jgi:hypothetical protein